MPHRDATVTTPDTLQSPPSSSSPSYDFCGTPSDGGGTGSSASFKADTTLGGIAGFSSSLNYGVELLSDTCLAEWVLRRPNAQGFEQDWSDYDNDGTVTIFDIAQAASVYNQPNNYWDLNLNGVTDIFDIARAAFYYGSYLGDPYLGKGYPAGTMDPSWTSNCALLPEPHQTYCETRI